MSTKKWHNATIRYRSEIKPNLTPLTEKEKAALAEKLRLFLTSSKGTIALELLKASKKFIFLAQKTDGAEVRFFVLSKDGLRQFLVENGGQAALIPNPNTSPATAEEIIEASGVEGRRLKACIYRGLDHIAAHAPIF